MTAQTLYTDTDHPIVVDRTPQHVYLVTKGGTTHSPESVTQILRRLDKPALVPWAANQCAEYIRQEIKPWEGEPMSEPVWEAILAEMVKKFRKVASDAADIGTAVHLWVRNYALGIKQPMPAHELQAAAVERFLAWRRQHDLELIAASRYIYHVGLDYVGELDLLFMLDGKRTLADIKTTKAIYPDHHYQTAAYARAYDVEVNDGETTRTLILRCGKDGSFEAVARDVTQVTRDFAVFIPLVDLAHAIKASDV